MPFYYSSGPGATVPEGHGTQFGVAVPTIDESTSPDQFVKDRVKEGADYIKILREPFMPTINFDQTREVIETAHEHSKLCVSHVSLLADAMKLARQDIDGYVHIWSDKEISDKQLDSLSRKEVFVVPTLLVIKKFLKAAKREGWVDTLLVFNKVVEEVSKLYEKGIPILAGTDCPNFFLNCDSDLIREMKLLREAGLSNIDVLKAATFNVHHSFRLREFDILQKDGRASFFMINGNPLESIDHLKDIDAIWQNGMLVGNRTL